MVPIFDLHQDSLNRMFKENTDFFNEVEGAVNYKKLLSGNVKGSIFAIFSENNSKEEIIAQIKNFNLICSRNQVKHITNFDQIDLNKNYINAILHLEGADLIGTKVILLEELYQLGIRSIGLVWMDSNQFAGGLKEEMRGLTVEGIKFVEKCNNLGIIIDVSHMNEKSFYDVILNTKKPIMASHSNCYSINPNKRNLTDEQIKAIAKNKGVIGLSLNPVFIKNFNGAWIDPVETTTTFKDVCAHINHIKNLVGVDYISLGSDFDGAPVPEILQDASEYQKLIDHLKKEGYSNEDIEKIAYKNFLRVLIEQAK